MKGLRYIFWNLPGPFTQDKRERIFPILKRFNADFILLCETHLSGNHVLNQNPAQVLARCWDDDALPDDDLLDRTSWWSTNDNNTWDTRCCGTAILMRPGLDVKVLKVEHRQDGRGSSILFQHNNGEQESLHAVYVPAGDANARSAFLDQLNFDYTAFPNPRIAGDWQIFLDPALDAAAAPGAPPRTAHAALPAMRRMLQRNSLIDIFRVLNPTTQAMTHSSN